MPHRSVAILHPHSLPEWIIRTIRAVWTTSAIWIIDGIRRKLAAISAIRVGHRIWVIRIVAQSPVIIPLTVIELRALSGVGVGYGIGAVGASKLAERIVDAVGIIGAACPVGIGAGVRCIGVCTIIADVPATPCQISK